MKVLVIDDSREFRDLVEVYLRKQFKDIGVVKYDVNEKGKPADDFDWSVYDVVLLDYNLGGGENGFNWLKEFREKPGFPPTIILTAEGDEYIAIKAIKLGAADYMNKIDITPQRLAEIVNEARDYTADKISELEEDKVNAENLVKELYQKDKRTRRSPDIGSDYKIMRIIGQGGMSKVYLAERISNSLSLVLKIFDVHKASNETSVKRFIREAELLEKLDNPFVCKIYDHGMTEDYGFIAMEFFSRGDLKQRMDLKLSNELVFNYMTHVAYGLDAIHKVGIIHRDLKPANIMFRGDDSLALADFGISKKIDDTFDLTTLGQIIGTPHYISPEQGEGRLVDHRTDIYSAGVMLYELLVKEKPYKASTAAAMIYQHIHADIPRLPDQLQTYQPIIDKTLAKNPDDRYQSAEELIHDLEKVEKACH